MWFPQRFEMRGLCKATNCMFGENQYLCDMEDKKVSVLVD